MAFRTRRYTWRHLGPHLARRGYRVVAPWLPGYDAPVRQAGQRRHLCAPLLDVRRAYRGGRTRGPDRARLGCARRLWGRGGRPGSIRPIRRACRSADRRAGRRHCSATPNSSGRSTSGSSSRSAWPRPRCGARVLGVAVGGLVAGLRRRATTSLSCADMSLPTTSPMSSRLPRIVQPAVRRPRSQKPKRRRRCSRRRCRRCTCTAPTTARSAPICSPTSSPHLPAAGSAFEIIDGVGHFLHLEKPELIAAKISDWLGG